MVLEDLVAVLEVLAVRDLEVPAVVDPEVLGVADPEVLVVPVVVVHCVRTMDLEEVPGVHVVEEVATGPCRRVVASFLVGAGRRVLH